MSPAQARSGRVAPSKSEIEEARALAREVGLEYVDLDRYPLNAAAASLLPEQLAKSHHALAVGWKFGTPVIAVATPDNVIAMDDLRTVLGRDVHAVVACASQIEAYIERLYNGSAAGSGSSAQAGSGARSGSETPPSDARAPAGSVAPEGAAGGASEGAGVASEAALPGLDDAGVASENGALPELELLGEILESGDPLEGAKTGVRRSTKRSKGWAAPNADTGGPKPALAEVLVASGQVTKEEMQAAVRESTATGRPLGEILAELGLVSEEDLMRALALEVGLEFVDLNEHTIDSKITSFIPEALARRHQLIGIEFRGNAPVIAMANPSNVFALDDLRTMLGRDLIIVVSSPRQIADYISRVYRPDKEAADAARNAASQTTDSGAAALADLTDLHAVVEDAPIVKYVNLILRQALQERASDVHIEPTADDLRIRFRIDGVLHDITRSPKSIHGGVSTRLKVMADLDIAEHRIPQDGRISLNAGQREIDMRVASLPTVHGEKIVLRILDKTNAMLDLGELGFLPEVKSRYESSYRKPYGTILVTGPTGSGKSTTLYATLNALNSPERNVITVEDPVEYQLPGVNQVQVNPKAGLSFANALRSILRADPDIILVGEIRDRETAVIAIEAALTGHLVLSSVHTNDAAGTPMRLVEMGVEPFLVGSSIDCVVAQRLARQLCENCAEEHEPTPEELEVFGWTDADLPPGGSARFRKAVGCQACSRTGYRGRIALHELLVVTEEVERSIIAASSVEMIRRIAVEQGMVPLRHDGLRKAALGHTSLEEVIRVVA
jgi:type IV pilus assembly protein PilB